MRASPTALWAYPQTIVSFVLIDFSEVHRRPVSETPDCGNHFQIIPMSVLARQEVSTRDTVEDEAIRLRTGKRDGLSSVFPADGKTLLLLHLDVVLIKKGANAFGWM